MSLLPRRHWRTILGAVAGAAGGGLYAHFVGCRTGTCLITSNVWMAASFFGFMGAVIGAPAPGRKGASARSPGAAP